MPRYLLSTLAYAEFRSAGLRLAGTAALLTVPDVTIYLHAARATRAERLRGRDGNSRENARTLDAGIDARLDAAFRRGRTLPIAERFVSVDTTGRSPWRWWQP